MEKFYQIVKDAGLWFYSLEDLDVREEEMRMDEEKLESIEEMARQFQTGNLILENLFEKTIFLKVENPKEFQKKFGFTSQDCLLSDLVFKDVVVELKKFSKEKFEFNRFSGEEEWAEKLENIDEETKKILEKWKPDHRLIKAFQPEQAKRELIKSLEETVKSLVSEENNTEARENFYWELSNAVDDYKKQQRSKKRNGWVL